MGDQALVFDAYPALKLMPAGFHSYIFIEFFQPSPLTRSVYTPFGTMALVFASTPEPLGPIVPERTRVGRLSPEGSSKPCW